MKSYKPVSCELHSRYELLIMQHSSITLHYRDGRNEEKHVSGTPIDLYTRNGEEYLVIQLTHAPALHIRLDRIIDCREA